MRNKIKFILILLFILIIILIFAKFIIKETPKINDGDQVESILENKTKDPIITQPEPEKVPPTKTVTKSNKTSTFKCPIPQKEYDDMSLLNIGQDIGLPDITYIPKDLIKLDTEYSTKNICLVKEAGDAFELMAKDAKKEKYNIKASSGFRSYEYQKSLIENAIKAGKKDTSVSIAKAGYSEHQLGTTVDITSSSIDYDSASNDFYKTPESDWLKKNAYLYGFIQSYSLGKEDITGYKSEPWHYRYVGIENAKLIKDSDLTITEFLK